VSTVFVFDGDCAFCSTTARFLDRYIPTQARVQAWQFSDLSALGLTQAECEEAVQWVRVGEHRHLSGPAAIAALLRESRGVWRAAGLLLGTRPALAAAAPVYRWIARNRHRLPGGTPACSLPAAQRANPHAE
jgi:predicted DCC family thiol-disulfide oxidoreductase YuxK